MAEDRVVTFDGEQAADYPEGLYQARLRAEPVTDLGSVVEVDIESYRERGYLPVRSAFSRRQVEDGVAGLESLVLEPRGAQVQFEAWAERRLAELDGQARLDAVRKFMGFVDHEPRLRAIAYDPALIGLVRRLIGSDQIVLIQDMALLKPPGGGREKPWHQDNAFLTVAPDSPIVGVWIALDEATPENGCMHVISGSHREGTVVHFRRRDWQICDADVEAHRVTAIPLPPGGALFFDGLLHHGTPANRTKWRRRALQFHYIAADAARISTDERLAIFGSEGKDVTC